MNILVFVLGIFGLVALGIWIYKSSQNSLNLGAFAFWRSKSWLILSFWLSVLADMFIVYRLNEEEALKQKIEFAKYAKPKKSIATPDNWQGLKRINKKYKIEISAAFSYACMNAAEGAFMLANKLGHSEVKAIHLFYSLLRDHEISIIFSRLNIDGIKLIEKLKNQLALMSLNNPQTELSAEIKEIFIDAYVDASLNRQKKVETINLILPCLNKDKILSEILYDLEIDHDKINNVIEWMRISHRLHENYRLYKKMAGFKPSSSMDRAYTAVATPVLNHFAYDLTIAAKWGRLELCVARDKETDAIFQAIESGHSGIILVGAPGTGKNTIVGNIAQFMVKEDVPKILKDKRLVELDVSRLISGASAAQAEERLLVIIDEISRARNIVLYINHIENLMGLSSGEEGSLDLSEVLANALDKNALICLASTKDDDYAKYIENTPLGRIMAKILVEEPENNQAIQMIESKIGYFEAKYKVYFSYNSIAKAVELTRKYIHDKYLPDKAIDILETIAVQVVKKKGDGSIVTEDDVAETVSEATNIPVTKVSQKEGEELLHLEDKIHERMIDQVEAVDMVAASLRRARTELRETKRPIASFLFLGPTGVGKTELAKSVADVYFGNEEYMVRVDMSEYQLQESVEKMIGNPNGTLGYLTEQVRKSPFSLVLLDEIEKAHPDILNLFLQVMDDGRLTDGQGRTIDFTNSIIIATSNIGAVFIEEQIIAGTKIEDIKQALTNNHLNKYLRPELINRFDGIVVFKPLSIEDVNNIAKIMLSKVKKMLEEKGMNLKCSPEGLANLAKEGFDPKFGARPLRRLIQEKIENEIANKILSGELKRRDIIKIDDNAAIQIEKGRQL